MPVSRRRNEKDYGSVVLQALQLRPTNPPFYCQQRYIYPRCNRSAFEPNKDVVPKSLCRAVFKVVFGVRLILRSQGNRYVKTPRSMCDRANVNALPIVKRYQNILSERVALKRRADRPL